MSVTVRFRMEKKLINLYSQRNINRQNLLEKKNKIMSFSERGSAERMRVTGCDFSFHDISPERYNILRRLW